MQFTTIRDPLWKNIGIDPLTLRLVDTPEFQRLRYVRQLGLAYLVYPGATHSRFEHALGTYHLARRTLDLLQVPAEKPITAEERGIVLAAALLHDIGHYPFSHALEEIGAPHHEDVAEPLITNGTIAAILSEVFGPDAPSEVFALVRGRSKSRLQRLISGSLDLDKIEYLKRDALMCGVPYGEIDVERLIESLRLVSAGIGPAFVAIAEKGLSALESLLFAKYQMYRNVYWHKAVRSATAMYKRLVDDAIRAGRLDTATLSTLTDEGLLHLLDDAEDRELLSALRERRLHKRVFERPATRLPEGAAEWVAEDRELCVEVENAMARELGRRPGSILLDYPVKTKMLDLDITVQRREGYLRDLTTKFSDGSLSPPWISEELYRSSRWLRVFSEKHLGGASGDALEVFLCLDPETVRRVLSTGAPIFRFFGSMMRSPDLPPDIIRY